MTFQEFINKYDGKGVNYDGSFGNHLDTPVFMFGLFSSLQCFLYGLKPSKVDLFIKNLNLGDPFISRLIPSNPRMSRRIIVSNSTVSKIGRVSTYAKIALSVIERIAVNVVNVFIHRTTHNKAVQFNKPVVSNSFLSVGFSTPHTNAPLSVTVSKSLSKSVVTVVKQADKLSVFFTNYMKLFHTHIISGVYQHSNKGVL